MGSKKDAPPRPPSTAKEQMDVAKKPRFTSSQKQLAALLTFLAYTCCYLLRKALVASSVSLQHNLGYAETTIGAISSSFAFSYGLSKLPGGVLADIMEPRILLFLALVICSGITFVVCSLSDPSLITLLWGVQGFVQGFTWSPCGKVVHAMFDKSEKAFWWSLVSTSQNLGAGITPILLQYVAEQHIPYPLPVYPQKEADASWRTGILLVVVFCFAVAFGVLSFIPKIQPPPKKVTGKDGSKEKSRGVVGDMLASLTKIPFSVTLIVFTNLLIYILRDAIGNWLILMMHESRGFSVATVAKGLGFFELGGLVGGMLSGIASDKVFDSKRGPIFVVCGVGLVISTYMLPHASTDMELFVVMTFLGVSLFGPQTIAGLFTMELVPSNISGLCGSLVALFSQIGGTMAGYPLSLLQKEYGWDSLFLLLPVTSIVFAVSSIPLWNAVALDSVEDSSQRNSDAEKKKN